MAKYVVYNGKKLSHSALARALGIHRNTINNRLKAGETIEDIISNPRRQVGPYGLSMEHNGEVHSLSDWSRALGLSRNAVRERLQRGWNVDDALSITK